jgi:hypothetical protein
METQMGKYFYHDRSKNVIRKQNAPCRDAFSEKKFFILHHCVCIL